MGDPTKFSDTDDYKVRPGQRSAGHGSHPGGQGSYPVHGSRPQEAGEGESFRWGTDRPDPCDFCGDIGMRYRYVEIRKVWYIQMARCGCEWGPVKGNLYTTPAQTRIFRWGASVPLWGEIDPEPSRWYSRYDVRLLIRPGTSKEDIQRWTRKGLEFLGKSLPAHMRPAQNAGEVSIPSESTSTTSDTDPKEGEVARTSSGSAPNAMTNLTKGG